MNNLFPGISLICVTSLANGVFSIPLRYRRRYAVENMWVLVFVLGYLVVPHIIMHWAVPNWAEAVRAVDPPRVWMMIAFGVLWGVASVFFSQGIARVGVSLGYAMIMGLTMVIGSIVPLARQEAVSSGQWAMALAGIAVGAVGVLAGGRAGVLRERNVAPVGQQAMQRPAGADGRGAFALGLIFCVVSGVLSACSNTGYDFAQPLARALTDRNVHPVLASLAPWLPLYWGGASTVLVISVIQMTRNKTWNRYRGTGAARDLRLTLLMALIISLTQMPYGMGATYLGKLGRSVGFAISMILSLAVANIVGVLAGEWRGAGKQAVRMLLASLACLTASTLLLAWASQV